MIVYLDTSAFVPLFVTEPSTQLCQDLWNTADDVFSVRLLRVETAAALAQAQRLGRISETDLTRSLATMNEQLEQVRVIELDDTLAKAAANAARDHALRGYDAVHCAAAATLPVDDLVAASGDRVLLNAWQAIGLATADTSFPLRSIG